MHSTLSRDVTVLALLLSLTCLCRIFLTLPSLSCMYSSLFGCSNFSPFSLLSLTVELRFCRLTRLSGLRGFFLRLYASEGFGIAPPTNQKPTNQPTITYNKRWIKLGGAHNWDSYKALFRYFNLYLWYIIIRQINKQTTWRETEISSIHLAIKTAGRLCRIDRRRS